jgi:hypothetical protein
MGGASGMPSSAKLALERTQLERVSSELRAAELAVRREVAASRVAWPAIADGLPAGVSPALLAATSAASARASSAQLPEPAFLTHARALTGPAAGIAGIYENYEQLARRGWLLIGAALTTIARASGASSAGAAMPAASRTGASAGAPRTSATAGAGAGGANKGASHPTASRTRAGASESTRQAQASFARANSSLYISAIYDGHFNLSLLGKSLVAGYEKLGGARAFEAALTPAEIAALATAYSIPAVRLTPHPGKAVERASGSG